MRLAIIRLLSFLLFIDIHERVYCFVLRSTSPPLSGHSNIKSQGNGGSALAIGKIASPPLFVKLPSTQSTYSSEIAQVSDALVKQLLLPSSQRQQDRISSLAKQLVQAKVDFDPNDCLDGPLYFSNVLEGPSPLWENLGIPFISQNLQGQQYTYNAEEKSVINYAEIFGSALHLRAYGTYEQDMSSPLLEECKEEEEDDSISSFFQGALSSLVPTPQEEPKLLTCPIDFVVTVDKASICVGDNRINIPIAGQGFLRVLYADPQLRIFVSPKSTTDSRWEREGLMVAQVRVDKKDPAFGILS